MERKNSKCYCIGITGKAGSGKTTVSDILRGYGIAVLDTDLLSKQLLYENEDIISVIEKIIGVSVTQNNRLDFNRVGKFFEDNPKLEKKFENWYQIYLGQQIIREAVTLEYKSDVLFFDIPLLHQKGIAHIFDCLWIVETKESMCVERIQKRNNYSRDKSESLVKNSSINKVLLSQNHKIIQNNKSIEELKRLVKVELDYLELNVNSTITK